MKTNLLLTFLFLLVFMPFAQGQQEAVYTTVEVMPTIGDCASLDNESERIKCTTERIMFFIQSEVKYPKELIEFGIEGTVYVRFVVDSNGNVTDAKVIRGVEASLDDEALRAVNELPKFNPGEQGGKAVAVEYTIPIKFSLSEH